MNEPSAGLALLLIGATVYLLRTDPEGSEGLPLLRPRRAGLT